MDKKYLNENIYVGLPSKIEENNFVQKPNDITIIKKDEQNNYIDIFTKEEIYVFQRDELNIDKKYIRVFRDDFTLLSNFVFSLKTDYIKDTKIYMELVMSIKSEYTLEELEKILSNIKKEIYNIKYPQTRKITTAKKRIRKK